MKTITNSWARVGILLVVVLLMLTVSTVTGQAPDGEIDQEPAGDKAASSEIILAQPPQTINYQGYLTDGDGNPLNGTYDLRFRLFDALTGGTIEWGPEYHNDTAVTNGLFQVALGISEPLRGNVFDEALYLSIHVDGVVISPRQPLRAVPYAFGLVPGAEVQGDPDVSKYALRVENEGRTTGDSGLYASGENYGLVAESMGGEIGIYSPNYVKAQGYQSTEDSFFWVPALAGELLDTSCTLQHTLGGYLTVFCPTGTHNFSFPLVVPAVMFGQNVYLESVEIYYAGSPTSCIDTTSVYKLTSTNTYDSVLSSLTDRCSTSATSYEVQASDDIELTADSGALTLRLGLEMTTPSGVTIGAVRVRLRHYPEP